MKTPAGVDAPAGVLAIRIVRLHVSDFGHLHHRFGGEERAVYRAHVDVPAFALRRLDAGQVAHGGLTALHILRRRADDELTLERIDGVFGVRNWTVAICQPVNVVAEQFAATIIGVDVWLEPHFRI